MTSIRDQSLVDGYLRELSQVVGADIDLVRREVSRAGKQHHAVTVVPPPQPQQPAGIPWPDPADISLSVERGFLKLVLQYPDLFDEDWDQVEVEDLRHPAYQAVFEAILSVPRGQENWAEEVGKATSRTRATPLRTPRGCDCCPSLTTSPTSSLASNAPTRTRIVSSTTRCSPTW